MAIAPIKEICISRTGNPEMTELVNQVFELKDDPKYEHYHVVYIDYDSGPCFIYKKRFLQPLEIPELNFKQRLDLLENTSFSELCFLLATYASAKKTTPNCRITLDELTVEQRKILGPTKGYLIFKDQGAEYYKLLTGADNAAAWQWVEDVQAYKKSVLSTFPKLEVNGKPFADFFTPGEYGPRFKDRPNRAAYDLFKYLNPDKQILNGNIHVRHVEWEANDIESKHELIPARFIVDHDGDYRIGFHLFNDTLTINEEIEFGLNFDYCSNPKLLPMGCQIQHISEDEFIVEGDIVQKDGAAVDYVSFPFQARFSGKLPEGIEDKLTVNKLF